MLSAGLIIELMRVVDEQALHTVIVEALAPYRTPEGGNRLEK